MNAARVRGGRAEKRLELPCEVDRNSSPVEIEIWVMNSGIVL